MENTFLDYVGVALQGAVAIAAFIALRQISITREVARTNSKRESIKLTADQCRTYAEKVVPVLNTLDEVIAKHNFRFLKDSQVEIDGETIKIKPFFDYPEYAATLPEIAPYISTAYNALNSFALYFVSGVADERYGYATLGTSYCNSVRMLLPFIVSWSSETREDNVLRLFMLWNSRKERDANQEELTKLRTKLENTRVIEIRPIGT